MINDLGKYLKNSFGATEFEYKGKMYFEAIDNLWLQVED